MPLLRHHLYRLSMIATGLAVLSSLGSAKETKFTVAEMIVDYQPERSSVQIKASATVEVQVTVDNSIQDYLRKRVRYSEATMINHSRALVETLTNDIVRSEIFTRMLPTGDPRADYLIKIEYNESDYPAWIVRMTLRLIEAKSKREISVHSLERPAGQTDYKHLFPGMMATLKTDMLNDLKRLAQQQALPAQAEAFQKAALIDLLAASDTWAAVARERNRALIAAKTTQLPGLLRDTGTDGLTALMVKIEQTILDLNHECEVAKGRAQQAVSAYGNTRQIEELRELAISYRERIELLKPIATAIKDEIANRSR